MLKNITLELSIKPFRTSDISAIEPVCRKMFRQWWALAKHADVVSVLLWLADGSEILDYDGDMGRTFEWAKWLGRANLCDPQKENDPENEWISRTPRVYMDNPPEYTYGWIKCLTKILKKVGREVTGKPVRVGITFDPGPEFAKSSFKYERHTEARLNTDNEIGKWICCYSTLHADRYPYAGYPDGIPEGTSFGKFLGKQSQCFCDDLGFDYIWLSNGFGFGLETWGMYGSVFDGQKFNYKNAPFVREKNLNFWNDFRVECPELPVETRGTNLSTGMDLSSDAVPLQEIYQGNFGIQPPPNSPWAALNGDFGMELIGWMSHIAEIPGNTFPFRFYTHDPWWMNSPWLDRYGKHAHDIFLPMSIARMDADGNVQSPSSIEFLSVDDSMGKMPEEVPNEVIPNMLSCLKTSPDAPGPLLWVYPFTEYHAMTYSAKRLEEVFFGDWYMRSAFNQGLPLNTVISTDNFVQAAGKTPKVFRNSVMVTPVPDAGSEMDRLLRQEYQNGGRFLLYGSLKHASSELLELLHITIGEELEGEFDLCMEYEQDSYLNGKPSMKIKHDAISSACGLCEQAKSSECNIRIKALKDKTERLMGAVCGAEGEGIIVWVRGSNSFSLPESKGAHQPTMHSEEKFYRCEKFMRLCLEEFGMNFSAEHFELDTDGRMLPGRTGPMMTISRNRNAFWFATHAPDASAIQRWRMPMGFPVFANEDMRFEDGNTLFPSRRAWRGECRIFVEQEGRGRWTCREIAVTASGFDRGLTVDGLNNARICFFPASCEKESVKILLNPPVGTQYTGKVEVPEMEDTPFGKCYSLSGITGSIRFMWK